MRNVICFTINNHELKDELDGNKYLSSKLDYKDIKGDTFLCYPPEIYDKFSDFALSRGYNNSEDFWEVDDEGKEADTDWTDGKFHMKENSMNKYEIELKRKIKGSGLTTFPGKDEWSFFISKPGEHINARALVDVKNKQIISSGRLDSVSLDKYFNDYTRLRENKMKKLTVEQKAKVIKFAKDLVDKKIIKENNNYTMISALREIADDLLLQTELLIDRQYGKVEHDAFKNQWYKTANEFEKKFKTIIKSLMKSGQ